MESKYFKFILISIFFILILGLKTTVQANSINSIDMDIFIDDYGNANVTEVWNCRTNEGTESYHPYYNLGNSKITNLTVFDKNQKYTTLDTWNTSGSLSSKAYKCGINKISNGVELCWGISNYGNNTYTVKYNISNFVSELTDSQMAYWTLIPYDFSVSIGRKKIKIHSNSYFEDTIDVWGYGNYGGLCYVNNGAIYMDSDGKLDQSEYMTILAKFPQGRFKTTNKLNGNFESYYQMAQDGAKQFKDSIWSKILSVIISIISFCMSILPIIIIVVLAIINSNGYYGFKAGPEGKKIPRDVSYYRDIPCSGDIFRSYYIAYQYGLIKNKTDILGAIILKWLKQGIIKTENKEQGKVFKKENTVIILGDNPNIQFENSKETELFHMMYVASIDGILENKEFERWCKRSYEKILGWFDNILEEQREILVSDGLIKREKRRAFSDKYVSTPELKEIAISLAGLKRFLLDYTLIMQREAIEVELFEDYLIYAQMMGIAKQVSKQFKELYPDMIQQTHYGSYDNIVYINYCASSGISSANSARAAAENYSSGGGGFSSGGGGSGSFGGGGGRRRIPLKI